MGIEQFGKYHILEELGKGGFATVYRAVDTTLDREVALKVLDPLLMRDATWAERFRREAKTIAALKHPAIISIYEVNEVEGRLYLAMELAAGGSLAGVIAARGRLPWAETLALLKPVCEALDYAHGQGVIHRDLKPANILLTAEGQPLLTDFGFARLLGDNSMSLSLSGGILGTPAYIAPEVWELDAADAPADIYALGCIVYEMLAGEVLFQSKTPMQAVRAHDQGPKYTETWPEGTPDGLATALNKALARDPGARYPTAGTFWHALNALEAEAETARQAAQLAAVADQWRVETKSAMQAGEWSAAKLTLGRWLKVAPGNKDALKAQRQIEAAMAEQARQQQEAEQERQRLVAEQERQKQAAQLAANVSQWRAKAESAMKTGEWDAAKRAVDQWLAVTPKDKEALALQTEVARRVREAKLPTVPSPNAQKRVYAQQQPLQAAREQEPAMPSPDVQYRTYAQQPPTKAARVQQTAMPSPDMQHRPYVQQQQPPRAAMPKKSKPSRRVPAWGWIVGAAVLVTCALIVSVTMRWIALGGEVTVLPTEPAFALTPTDRLSQTSIPDLTSTPTPSPIARPRRILYIWYTDSILASEYETLLQEKAFDVDVIDMNTIPETDFSQYGLVIIGPDTIGSGEADAWYNAWGDETSVSKVENSQLPVIGLGQGGQGFFGRLNLDIGGGNAWHGQEHGIIMSDSSHPVFQSLNSLHEDPLIIYSTDVPEDGTYMPYREQDITLIGREIDDPNHYPIIQQGRFMMWGFTASPTLLTPDGKLLFENVVQYMLGKREKIVVATDATWPPMEFEDENKILVGYDIDLMRSIANETGLEVEFKNVSWTVMFAGLMTGEYDAAISGILITEERKQEYDISEPYINVGQVIVVDTDSVITNLNDLKGRTVGAQLSTYGAFEVQKMEGVILKEYDELGPAFEDLVIGRIDALVCDMPVAANYASLREEYKAKLKIVSEPFTYEYCGILVQKGNVELLEIINKGLKGIQDKGVDEQLIEKWLR